MSKDIKIEVDGKSLQIRSGITIKDALEIHGYKITKYPEKGSLFVPCEVGGCWSCAVEVNQELKPTCVTPVKESLRIRTRLPKDFIPKRIVHGFSGHSVGGVGTPWWIKRSYGYIEAACFAAGCNFRCRQCQNWETTYLGKGDALTPQEAAAIMTKTRRDLQVNRMAISGGESTLNKKWLIQYVKELKKLNPDRNARIHVDTNASILTRDYIDELVEAGVTDIGPDLKGYYPQTFMRITAVEDTELIEKYLHTAWDAVRYLISAYKDRVFTGIGIPYNKELISTEELGVIGEKVFEIDPEIQVCVLDYRPEFRRRDLVKPGWDEMVKIHRLKIGLNSR